MYEPFTHINPCRRGATAHLMPDSWSIFDQTVVVGRVADTTHPITRPVASICRATSASSAIASTAGSTSLPCFRASAGPPCGRRPCRAACWCWLSHVIIRSEDALLNQRVCKIDEISDDVDRDYLGPSSPAPSTASCEPRRRGTAPRDVHSTEPQARSA